MLRRHVDHALGAVERPPSDDELTRKLTDLCADRLPPEAAQRLARIAWGLADVFRDHHPDEPGEYSWWDYRGVAFFKNQGLRIDLIYLTQPLVARCTACTIDRNARKGQDPSDHAPVVAVIG